MKKLWNKIKKAIFKSQECKTFEVSFLMDGNLEPLHKMTFMGFSKKEVKKEFDSFDLESRRDIVSIDLLTFEKDNVHREKVDT